MTKFSRIAILPVFIHSATPVALFKCEPMKNGITLQYGQTGFDGCNDCYCMWNGKSIVLACTNNTCTPEGVQRNNDRSGETPGMDNGSDYSNYFEGEDGETSDAFYDNLIDAEQKMNDIEHDPVYEYEIPELPGKITNSKYGLEKIPDSVVDELNLVKKTKQEVDKIEPDYEDFQVDLGMLPQGDKKEVMCRIDDVIIRAGYSGPCGNCNQCTCNLDGSWQVSECETYLQTNLKNPPRNENTFTEDQDLISLGRECTLNSGTVLKHGYKGKCDKCEVCTCDDGHWRTMMCWR